MSSSFMRRLTTVLTFTIIPSSAGIFQRMINYSGFPLASVRYIGYSMSMENETLKPGEIVKYTDPTCEQEAGFRFVLLENNGNRYKVQLISDTMRFPPI